MKKERERWKITTGHVHQQQPARGGGVRGLRVQETKSQTLFLCFERINSILVFNAGYLKQHLPTRVLHPRWITRLKSFKVGNHFRTRSAAQKGSTASFGSFFVVEWNV